MSDSLDVWNRDYAATRETQIAVILFFGFLFLIYYLQTSIFPALSDRLSAHCSASTALSEAAKTNFSNLADIQEVHKPIGQRERQTPIKRRNHTSTPRNIRLVPSFEMYDESDPQEYSMTSKVTDINQRLPFDSSIIENSPSIPILPQQNTRISPSIVNYINESKSTCHESHEKERVSIIAQQDADYLISVQMDAQKEQNKAYSASAVQSAYPHNELQVLIHLLAYISQVVIFL